MDQQATDKIGRLAVGLTVVIGLWTIFSSLTMHSRCDPTDTSTYFHNPGFHGTMKQWVTAYAVASWKEASDWQAGRQRRYDAPSWRYGYCY